MLLFKNMETSSDIFFDLEQGWAKGLSISFLGVQSSMKFDSSSSYLVKQVHGKNIVNWQNIPKTGVASLEADGIYAQGEEFKKSKAQLYIKTADCMPLVYVDRQKEAVVLIHAGWRGLAQGIHLEPFHNNLCSPQDTWIWLGPSLSGMNFQVQEDMWKQFPLYCDNEKYFKKSDDSKFRYFHSWKLVEDQFREVGVELFYNVEIDTFANKSFFSWRRAQKAGAEKLPVQNISLVQFKK